MKILSIGNFGHGWDGSICDEEHIAGALEELGHEVHRQQREDRIWDHRGVKFDFILVAQWDGYAPAMMQNMKDQDGCPIVYWAFDYQADGQEWHERLVKEADLYLSKRIADSKYPNWQWLAQDFAPKFLNKYPEQRPDGLWNEPIEKDIDVLFTGSYLPWATERNETLKAVDERFNLVIHSVNEWPGFKDVRPPIMDEGLPELYARAKVILSIDHTIEAGYWSDRLAQIMCCGSGIILQRYVPMMEVVFRQYPAMYFYNKEDCLKRVEQALEIPLEDHFLFTGPAYRFAQLNLKVEDRVKDLLTIVGSIL